MVYEVVHHYLTIGEKGWAVVEREERRTDVDGVAHAVAEMLDNPGGRSGTTISLTITAAETIRL